MEIRFVFIAQKDKRMLVKLHIHHANAKLVKKPELC